MGEGEAQGALFYHPLHFHLVINTTVEQTTSSCTSLVISPRTRTHTPLNFEWYFSNSGKCIQFGPEITFTSYGLEIKNGIII